MTQLGVTTGISKIPASSQLAKSVVVETICVICSRFMDSSGFLKSAEAPPSSRNSLNCEFTLIHLHF